MLLIDDTIYYVQLLRRNYPALFEDISVKHSGGRKQLADRLCKSQPFLKKAVVVEAITNLVDRFKKIPALPNADNHPDIPSKPQVFTKKQIANFKHYERVIKRLEALPQHGQRTPGWYRDRMKVVTASSGGTAIGEDHYKNMYEFILNKCGRDDNFTANANTHHGCKYEDVAVMIYERRFDVIIKNFGLILHPDGKSVGASPDGICSEKRLSGGYSPLVGRMLEIKCVVQRQINTVGEIDGDICPHHYWIQVQLQLQCCSLDECDFWQCKLVELGRADWCKEISLNGMSALTGLEMGCVIELLPRDKVAKGEPCRYEAKYLYPPRAGMSRSQLEDWIVTAKAGIDGGKLYKDNEDDEGRWFDYHKVLYWRLDKAHCQLIKRDDAWFAKTYPRIKKTWSYIEWFRKHEDALNTWHDYSKSHKGMKNLEMMEVADRLMNDNRRGSYLKDLKRRLAKDKTRYVKYEDKIVFNMNDLASLVNESD
jgi:putative phage-type endonuclease